MLGHPKKEPAAPLQAEGAEADAPEQGTPTASAASEPAAVDADAAPHDWQRFRRAARSRDLYPSTQALAWLADLPHAVVPRRLAHDYPRIVNRLAACWCDPALATLVLDSLLVDRRGGRRGFPPAVELELRGLHAEALRRAGPEAANDGVAGPARPAPQR